jgi:hypothetical protein
MTVLAFSETLRRMCGFSEGLNPLMVSPLVAAIVEERRWTDRLVVAVRRDGDGDDDDDEKRGE